jgi:hypothetical protein
VSSLSLPMPLASGFVGFDEAPRARVERPSRPAPAARAEPAVRREALPEAEAPAGVVVDAPADAGLLQSPAWRPASSGRVRAVEGAVIAALCGWFLYGGLAVFGIV